MSKSMQTFWSRRGFRRCKPAESKPMKPPPMLPPREGLAAGMRHGPAHRQAIREAIAAKES